MPKRPIAAITNLKHKKARDVRTLTSFRLPPQLLDKSRRCAETHKQTLTDLVIKALESWLEDHAA